MSVSEKFISMFPKDEHDLFLKNQELQDNLLKEISAVAREDEKKYLDTFVRDGFYPYYTKQKVKILIMGKECLGLCSDDYIEILLEHIWKNDPRGSGNYSNNRDPFVSKELYITYGLNHDCCEYKDMPCASEIGTNGFAKEGGISFAFMNISKFDNPSETSYSADIERMDKFCELMQRTGTNWHEKQIALLDPDLIITMNLDPWLSRLFGQNIWDNEACPEFNNKDANIGHLPINGKMIPTINTWHFSYARKAFAKCYYDPIVRSCKEYFHIL